MKKLLATACVIALLAALAACGRSPNAPTPTCNDRNAINNGATGDCKYPNALAGTKVQTFPLPGTDKPLFVWITAINPAKGSQVSASSATVTWQCAGPPEYSAWISRHFIKEDQATDLRDSSGGSSFNFATDCGGSFTSGMSPNTTGTIASFQLLVWTAKGSSVDMKFPAPRDADYEGHELLGWQIAK